MVYLPINVVYNFKISVFSLQFYFQPIHALVHFCVALCNRRRRLIIQHIIIIDTRRRRFVGEVSIATVSE